MDKVLRPERLGADPNSSEASKDWLHWRRTFQNFLAVLDREGLDNLGVLTNFLSPRIYQYIEDCGDYPTAMETLHSLYIKPTNEVYAPHILSTRRQQSTETLDEYLQVLKALSKDCNYQNVSSIKYREESVRDAFISGLTSGLVHQRLLENNTRDLKTMFDLARSLESAAHSSETYMATPPSFNAAV